MLLSKSIAHCSVSLLTMNDCSVCESKEGKTHKTRDISAHLRMFMATPAQAIKMPRMGTELKLQCEEEETRKRYITGEMRTIETDNGAK